METCVDCVTRGEFFGSIVVGMVSFLALWYALRLREGYVRDKRVEEWQAMIREMQEKRRGHDR